MLTSAACHSDIAAGTGKGVFLFTGLKSYSSDTSESNFYWLFCFPEDHPAESWIKTASKAELLKLAFVKDSAFREIVVLLPAEGGGYGRAVQHARSRAGDVS